MIESKIKSLPTKYQCVWEFFMYISLQTCSCSFHPHLQWFSSFKPVCDSHLSFAVNWGSWHSRESSVATPEMICHEKSRYLLLEFHPISYNYLCGPGHVNSSFKTCICVWSHTLHLIVVLVGCLSLLTVQKGAMFIPLYHGTNCKVLHMVGGEGNGTHSSALAWSIPGTGEPGGLQSMESLRVGHDWVTSLSLFPFMHWRRKWQSTLVFLPGESQGRGSLVGCRLWGHTESDTTDDDVWHIRSST